MYNITKVVIYSSVAIIVPAICINYGRFHGHLDHVTRPDREDARVALFAWLSWLGGKRSDVVDWLIS